MKLLRTLVAGIAVLAFAAPVFAEEVAAQDQLAPQAQPVADTTAAAPAASTDAAPAASTDATPSADAAKSETVNINTADAKALTSLKGIGKKRANAIVAYREKNGSFAAVEDLTKVKGVSKKIIEENKAKITV